MRTAKALAGLRGCAGLPEPSLVAYAISTIISWAGSFLFSSVPWSVEGERIGLIEILGISWFSDFALYLESSLNIHHSCAVDKTNTQQSDCYQLWTEDCVFFCSAITGNDALVINYQPNC